MFGNLKMLFIFVKEIRIMTHEEIEFIKKNALRISGAEMGRMFGVSKTTIYNIINELEIIDHEPLTVESVLENMPKMRCTQFAKLVKKGVRTVKEFCFQNGIEEEWQGREYFSKFEREVPPQVEKDYHLSLIHI